MDSINKYGPNPEKPLTKTVKLEALPKCPIDNGMIDYLNDHKVIYHVDKVNKTWAACNDDVNYDITVEASME